MGARAIHDPEDMPWNQRTALFADPDGNIHEIFADIKQIINYSNYINLSIYMDV